MVNDWPLATFVRTDGFNVRGSRLLNSSEGPTVATSRDLTIHSSPFQSSIYGN